MIEFDQRYFNDGFDEFQAMISDMRKQIKLNDQILQIKKMIQAQNNQKTGKVMKEANLNVKNQELKKQISKLIH